jgi:hypothetical protein
MRDDFGVIVNLPETDLEEVLAKLRNLKVIVTVVGFQMLVQMILEDRTYGSNSDVFGRTSGTAGPSLAEACALIQFPERANEDWWGNMDKELRRHLADWVATMRTCVAHVLAGDRLSAYQWAVVTGMAISVIGHPAAERDQGTWLGVLQSPEVMAIPPWVPWQANNPGPVEGSDECFRLRSERVRDQVLEATRRVVDATGGLLEVRAWGYGQTPHLPALGVHRSRGLLYSSTALGRKLRGWWARRAQE